MCTSRFSAPTTCTVLYFSTPFYNSTAFQGVREQGERDKHPFSTKINYFCTEYSTVLTPTAEGPIDYSGKGSRVLPEHRRRIELEDKAKVVASVWGTQFIQFLAALAILPWSIEKKRNWINLAPQAAVTTFVFSSVSILLLGE